MSKDNMLYSREDLLNLGIYELRELGRDVGVPSPTTLKKENLVDSILSIIYGEAPKRAVGKGRGRPVRAKDKPSKLFIDLIEKMETPKCETSFILPDEYLSDSFSYGNMLSSKVASVAVDYDYNQTEEAYLKLKKAIVCEEDGKYYARKLRFVKSVSDLEIPFEIVCEYRIQDNDLIEFLAEGASGKIAKIFKINEKIATKQPTQFKLVTSLDQAKVAVDNFIVNVGEAHIIYAPTVMERQRIIDAVCAGFNQKEFTSIKVCFDKMQADKLDDSSLNLEICASSMGDEYETIAMVESALEKAKLFSTLGRKVLVAIDNLPWLLSVIETYPKTTHGNFLEKFVKTIKSMNVTLVCLSSHMPNHQIDELSALFENILTK